MASTRIIEQDHGTYVGHITHRHNGYYAGDFRETRQGTARAFPTTGGVLRRLPRPADTPRLPDVAPPVSLGSRPGPSAVVV